MIRRVAFVLATLILLLTADSIGTQPASVPPLQLFLLAGQSNMAGRGTVEAEDRVPHSRVWMLDQQERWVPAVEPLHFDKPIAGVGPGRSFGIALADAEPGVNVGLVPVAVGGSPISTWEPGAVHSQTGSKPYDDAIRRIRAAKAAGEFKAILWHQGENDSGATATPDYEAKLTVLIGRLRAEVQNPGLPVLIGQLGRFADAPWSESRTTIDALHRKIARELPNVAFVSADGLVHKGDRLHFDSASARELGRRYAAMYRSMSGRGGEWRDDVQRFAQTLVDAQLVPGMGIAVTQGDRVVYSKGFGFADLASGRRADEATAFYIASSTKALTATAVLALSARRELDLNASVAHYLPALRGRARFDAGSVTLRDLLTMSHGIGGEDGGPVVFRTAYTGAFTPELLLELLAGYQQSSPPRQFRYGNLGYNILGLVLDSRQSHGWKDVVRREVLAPLGMRETSARVSDFETHAIALPHDSGADGKFHRIQLGKADANMHAAGGHFATARDLARFVAAHASSGRLDGVQVFPREMIASAHRKHIEQDRRFGPFDRFGWGYGWDLGTYGDETIVHRFGAFSGYRSHMSFIPDRGTGVVVLVNGGGPASAAADVMATYIYDRLESRPSLDAEYRLRVMDLQALADARRFNLAKDIAERRARAAPLPRALQDYAGVYENARFGGMEWRVVGQEMESRMGVAHSSAEVFDARQNQLRVSFTGEEEVVEFAFPPGGGSARALQYRGETFTRVKN